MSAHTEAALSLGERLKREAEETGYLLNPDPDFTLDLMDGLLVNQERYGYPSCPCRLATGERVLDRDIICPCDYRDPDLDEYGTCFCALYVSEAISQGNKRVGPVAERRGSAPSSPPHVEELAGFAPGGMPVWRCRVCGYLCARPQPPLRCPICKADKDRFERFGLGQTSQMKV